MEDEDDRCMGFEKCDERVASMIKERADAVDEDEAEVDTKRTE